MRIAVEGCAHGELDMIYETLLESEKLGKKVDLLLCCGDFQATRNWKDLKCMAVPDKYKDMGTFYKYYSGEKVAPVLTIFIGGNHEASNHLQELAYGGWVAPNIYYLGYAGVVTVAGIRIAGLSGIYKGHDFMKGHHEYPPYTDSTIRSAYHIRNLEIYRLKQLTGKIDVFMTHDWPQGITKYGKVNALLKKKPFFKNDIETGSLGSPPAMELLKHHYPSHWFAAHLHCEFAALVPKEDDSSKVTKFLALDKCLPRRRYLQIVEMEHDESLPIKLSYDLEWLTILFLTNHLLSVKNTMGYMPGPAGQGRWIFTPAEEEKERIHHQFNYDLTVPLNFKESVESYKPESPNKRVGQPNLATNSQTTEFCSKLVIDDPFALLKISTGITEENNSNKSFQTSTPSKEDTSFTDVSYSTEEEEYSFFVVDTTPSLNPRHMMSPLKLPVAKSDSTIYLEDQESLDPRPTISPLKLPVAKIDSTICLDDTENFNAKPRTPLKLPAVQANSTICLDDEESPQKVVQSNSSKSPRSFDEIQDNETPNGEGKVEPNCKKFKRRNQSIYTDTDVVA